MISELEIQSSLNAVVPDTREVTVMIDGVEVDKLSLRKGDPLESDAISAALKGRVVRDSSVVGGMDRIRVNYAGVGWRIIKRICTITAEVVS